MRKSLLDTRSPEISITLSGLSSPKNRGLEAKIFGILFSSLECMTRIVGREHMDLKLSFSLNSTSTPGKAKPKSSSRKQATRRTGPLSYGLHDAVSTHGQPQSSGRTYPLACPTCGSKEVEQLDLEEMQCSKCGKFTDWYEAYGLVRHRDEESRGC